MELYTDAVSSLFNLVNDVVKEESVLVRPAAAGDTDSIYRLYRKVASEPGGLARLADEVDESYVAGFLSAALERGLSFVAELGGDVVGEIHAYAPGIFCFGHVFGDLTIAVDPDAQGAGVGRKLFEQFMRGVRDERPDVQRVELIARESNLRAIQFYRSLGFVQERVFHNRIRNLDGSFESDIPMAWSRSG
jgi:ribosomal protein S18 acetylase RimI-like enzyme